MYLSQLIAVNSSARLATLYRLQADTDDVTLALVLQAYLAELRVEQGPEVARKLICDEDEIMGRKRECNLY